MNYCNVQTYETLLIVHRFIATVVHTLSNISCVLPKVLSYLDRSLFRTCSDIIDRFGRVFDSTKQLIHTLQTDTFGLRNQEPDIEEPAARQ